MSVARCYLRVSTEEQVSNFSLAAQRESLEAFAKSQEWRVGGWYVEEGVSAKDLNRPEFQRMIRDAQHGDIILVYKLDRLTRSVRDLDDLLREFEKRGLLFKCATQNFTTTDASGRLFIRMVAEFAQFERETLGERSSMGKQKRARSGEWPGGRVPFGYVAVPSGEIRNGRQLHRLEPDPVRAHLIPLIFERYHGGYGTRAIATWLNQEVRATSATGGQFSAGTVSDILKNPTYCGEVVYGKARKDRPMERIPGFHPPLITTETFEQVNRLFEQRKGLAPRQATGVYPLAGIARCGVCGGTICAGRRSNQKTKETGRTWRTYRCNNHVRRKGCGNSPLGSVSARAVEDDLVEQIGQLMPRSEEFDRFFRACQKDVVSVTGLAAKEGERLRVELAAAQTAVSQWDIKFERARITEEEHCAKTKPHLDRMREIKMRLAEYAETSRSVAPQEELLVAFVSFRDSWEGLTLEERKTALQSLVDFCPIDILVHPQRRVEIRHKLLA